MLGVMPLFRLGYGRVTSALLQHAPPETMTTTSHRQQCIRREELSKEVQTHNTIQFPPSPNMLFQLGSLVFTSFIIASNATPLSRNLVVHERRGAVPDGFTTGSAAPPNQTLNLRVALVNSDISGLESKLYDVSTPGNSNYGKHLSKDEVCSLNEFSGCSRSANLCELG